MQVSIDVELSFRVREDADLLLQIEAASLPEQAVEGALTMARTAHFARVPGADGIGERIWLRHRGALHLAYSAQATIDRILRDVTQMGVVAPHRLPGEVIPWLMPSVHVPAGRFTSFVESEFSGLCGGTKVVAMRDWIARHVRYERGASHGDTSAVDTFIERRGVCRDFAHLMLAFARAASIPARYASVYAPGVEPPDFHAVAELFLDGPDGGEWQLVDATGMAQPGEMVKVGVGRDASDVPFLVSFGGVVDELETSVTARRAGGQAAQA